MERKQSIDPTGAAALVLFALILGVNQVVIKVATDGFQPVFLAALRSVGALVVVLLWVRARGISLRIPPEARLGAALLGVFFTAEFICLYISLDLTGVGRASIIFYSMPIFVAVAAHWLLPGEQLSRIRALGLALAMAGVIWVMLDRSPGQHASLAGDILALLAALFWAGIALVVRLTPLDRASAEVQLTSQLAISAVLMLLLTPFFGPLIRDLTPIHWAALAFQVFAVASIGYLFWFFLLKRYPASDVVSFSFLSPVFGVLLGWLVLDEPIGPEIIGGLVLVAVGITLVNRR
jgi:drug/metabolite transporter (DMT)-like permease